MLKFLRPSASIWPDRVGLTESRRPRSRKSGHRRRRARQAGRRWNPRCLHPANRRGADRDGREQVQRLSTCADEPPGVTPGHAAMRRADRGNDLIPDGLRRQHPGRRPAHRALPCSSSVTSTGVPNGTRASTTSSREGHWTSVHCWSLAPTVQLRAQANRGPIRGGLQRRAVSHLFACLHAGAAAVRRLTDSCRAVCAVSGTGSPHAGSTTSPVPVRESPPQPPCWPGIAPRRR